MRYIYLNLGRNMKKEIGTSSLKKTKKKAKKRKKPCFVSLFLFHVLKNIFKFQHPILLLFHFAFFCLCRYEKATKTTTTTLKSVKSLIRMQINKSVVLESKREYKFKEQRNSGNNLR